MGVVALPALSAELARGDVARYLDLVTRGLRLVVFVMLPLTALGMVLRVQVIEVLFGYGRFDDAAIDRTATALLVLLLALPSESLIAILARAFYAGRDTTTPVIAAVLAVAINTIVAVATVGSLGLRGVALGHRPRLDRGGVVPGDPAAPAGSPGFDPLAIVRCPRPGRGRRARRRRRSRARRDRRPRRGRRSRAGAASLGGLVLATAAGGLVYLGVGRRPAASASSTPSARPGPIGPYARGEPWHDASAPAGRRGAGTTAAWDAFVDGDPRATYLQASAWAAVKAANGWRARARRRRPPAGGTTIGGQVLLRRPADRPVVVRVRPAWTARGQPGTAPTIAAWTDALRSTRWGERVAQVRIDPEIEAGRRPLDPDGALRRELAPAGWRAAPSIQPSVTRVVDLPRGRGRPLVGPADEVAPVREQGPLRRRHRRRGRRGPARRVPRDPDRDRAAGRDPDPGGLGVSRHLGCVPPIRPGAAPPRARARRRGRRRRSCSSGPATASSSRTAG